MEIMKRTVQKRENGRASSEEGRKSNGVTPDCRVDTETDPFLYVLDEFVNSWEAVVLFPSSWTQALLYPQSIYTFLAKYAGRCYGKNDWKVRITEAD